MEQKKSKSESEYLSEICQLYQTLINDDGSLFKYNATKLRDKIKEFIDTIEPDYFSTQNIWQLNSIISKEVEYVNIAYDQSINKATKKNKNELISLISKTNNKVRLIISVLLEKTKKT